jgi:hypothetical protein
VADSRNSVVAGEVVAASGGDCDVVGGGNLVVVRREVAASREGCDVAGGGNSVVAGREVAASRGGCDVKSYPSHSDLVKPPTFYHNDQLSPTLFWNSLCSSSSLCFPPQH